MKTRVIDRNGNKLTTFRLTYGTNFIVEALTVSQRRKRGEKHGLSERALHSVHVRCKEFLLKIVGELEKRINGPEIVRNMQ